MNSCVRKPSIFWLLITALLLPVSFSLAQTTSNSPTQQKQLTDLAQTSNQISKQATDYQGQFHTSPEQTQTLQNTGSIDQSLDQIKAANSSQCFLCGNPMPSPPNNEDKQACEKLNGDPFRVFVSARYSEINNPEKDLSRRTFDNCGTIKDALKLRDCERNKANREKFLKIDSEADFLKTMQEIAKGQTFDQFSDFVSRMGGDMYKSYDMNRNEEALKAKGGVDCLELIRAIRNGNKAGVCRDMAFCQTRMLAAGGIKAYTIAYATPGNYHTTVLAENPNSPGDSRIINYNEVLSNNSTSDAQVRSQPHSISAQGLVIRAYGSDGKPVTTLPTLVGQFLNEATGGSGRDFNPFLDDDSQIVSTQIQIGDDPCSRFSVSVGKLQDGTKAVTLAYIKDVETEESLHRFALALGGRENEQIYEKLTSADVYAKYEYVRKLLKAEFDSGKIDIYFKTRIEGMLSYMQSQLNDRSKTENLYVNMKTLSLMEGFLRSPNPMQTIQQISETMRQYKDPNPGGLTADGNASVELGLKGKQRITSSTQLDYYLSAQVQPGSVQVNTMGLDAKRYRGFVNLISSGVNVKQEISKGVYLELLLQAAIQEPTTVFGYKASVGSDAVRAYYRGSQSGRGQQPSVLSPGSFRTNALGVEWRNQASNAYWWVEMSEQRFGEGNKDKERRVDTGFSTQIDWGN